MNIFDIKPGDLLVCQKELPITIGKFCYVFNRVSFVVKTIKWEALLGTDMIRMEIKILCNNRIESILLNEEDFFKHFKVVQHVE